MNSQVVVTKIVSVSSWTSPFRLDIASYSAFVLPAYVAVFSSVISLFKDNAANSWSKASSSQDECSRRPRIIERVFGSTTEKPMQTKKDCLYWKQNYSADPAARFWSPNCAFNQQCKSSARKQTSQVQNLQDNTPALSRDHAVNNASDSSFSEAQLNTIRELIQESITAASREIANEAALAAVQVLQPNPPLSATTSICSQPTSEPLTQQQTPSLTDVCKHVAPFQDIPSQYIKDIQSGEFFELSKLLPKHLSALDEEDNLLLTLDNSVVRVSKKAKTSTCITEIEQWSTAFTTYMSVFTHKFPLRSQELLQYLSLIRYAARVHKGLRMGDL